MLFWRRKADENFFGKNVNFHIIDNNEGSEINLTELKTFEGTQKLESLRTKQ